MIKECYTISPRTLNDAWDRGYEYHDDDRDDDCDDDNEDNEADANVL